MDEITILDKTYISSKRAAEITGYAKDYVGQLCREGHVESKMVGRSWYVFEPSIRKHRFGEEEAVAFADSESLPVVEEEPLPAVIDEALKPEEPLIPVWQPSSVYKAEPVDMIPELHVPVSSTVSVISGAYKAEHTVYTDTDATLTDMQSAWREWFDKKQEPRIESPAVIDARNEAFEEASERENAQIEEEVPEVIAEAPELLLPEGYETEEEFSIPIHKIDAEEERSIRQEEREEDSSDYFVPIQRIQTAAEPARAYERVTTPVSTQYHDDVPKAAMEAGVIVNERVIKKGSSKVAKPSAKAAKRRRSAGAQSSAPAIAILIAISMFAIAVAAIGTGYADKYVSGKVINNPLVNFLVGNSSFKRQ